MLGFPLLCLGILLEPCVILYGVKYTRYLSVDLFQNQIYKRIANFRISKTKIIIITLYYKEKYNGNFT
jgi:hypothetical protein